MLSLCPYVIINVVASLFLLTRFCHECRHRTDTVVVTSTGTGVDTGVDTCIDTGPDMSSSPVHVQVQTLDWFLALIKRHRHENIHSYRFSSNT